MRRKNERKFYIPLAFLASFALLIITFSMASARVSEDKSNLRNNDVVLGTNQGPSFLEQSTSEKYEEVITNIDDDPYLGELIEADLVIVEFSDYESPLSYRFFTESYFQILEEYIESGNGVYVYRDLPLDFHPFAKTASVAANCIREQGGDEMYFLYHDRLFKNRPIQAEDSFYVDLADGLEIDTELFSECLKSRDSLGEIENDVLDARFLGIKSSPSFVIGKYNDEGRIVGYKVSGAIPLEEFESIIESVLTR